MVLLESTAIALGSPAHDFALPGTEGRTWSLSSFEKQKVLVIVFMCNHCPYVKAVLERLNALSTEFKTRGVQFVGINANDAAAYPDDSFAEMQKLPISFPYLYDESQEIARTYGAVCTPDIFVYNADRKLAYHGRIDDNWKEPEKVTRQELKAALEKILSGAEIPAAEQNPSMGCSIKWKS